MSTTTSLVADDPVVFEGLDAFFQHLEVEETASPHTLKAYRTDLTHFGRFLSAWIAGRETDYRGQAPGRPLQPGDGDLVGEHELISVIDQLLLPTLQRQLVLKSEPALAEVLTILTSQDQSLLVELRPLVVLAAQMYAPKSPELCYICLRICLMIQGSDAELPILLEAVFGQLKLPHTQPADRP